MVAWLWCALLVSFVIMTDWPLLQGQPVEYEYYYDEYPEAPAMKDKVREKEKEPNYDIEDLVKAWKEYLRDKKNNEDSSGSIRNTNTRTKPKAKEADYAEYECEPRSETYSTPDNAQCDKYFECNIKGEQTEKLCPDGLVFDINSQSCDYPAKVDCSGRPELQPAQPTENCPRANGFFPWPAEESCQKFWDCRGGKSYLQVCPEGVIFDPKVDACVTPDQSARPECAADKVLGFQCPTYTDEEPLRFGNHDRLPDPRDCVQFFSCLRSGQPRLGKCPRKTVFNNATGNCGVPKEVKGCETYWSDKEKAKGEEYDEYYAY